MTNPSLFEIYNSMLHDWLLLACIFGLSLIFAGVVVVLIVFRERRTPQNKK